MTATTISRFRKNCSGYFEQAVEYKEPIIVTMTNGNAIAEPLNECIDASEVEW